MMGLGNSIGWLYHGARREDSEAGMRGEHIIGLVMLLLLMCASSAAQASRPRSFSPMYNPDPPTARVPAGLPPMLNSVGFDQRLGAQVPLDASFLNEAGQRVKLGEFFTNRPVILVLVYYNCPMLCSEVLDGLSLSLRQVALTAGPDFEVVVVSFDPRNYPALASEKKQQFLATYKRAGSDEGLHFLTGEEGQIKRVTEAAGFRYAYDSSIGQYAHASGIMVATPDGCLSHYFYGIQYNPKDLRLALVEASGNKIGNAVDQVLLYCYHYDPVTGKYGVVVMNVLRIAGVVTLLAIGALLIVMRRRNQARIVPETREAT
jgi:protein SCO1/2